MRSELLKIERGTRFAVSEIYKRGSCLGDIYKRGSCLAVYTREEVVLVISTREEVVLVSGYAVRGTQ